jgi:hypothetical protein
MTRIRFERSGAVSPYLSPVRRTPVFAPATLPDRSRNAGRHRYFKSTGTSTKAVANVFTQIWVNTAGPRRHHQRVSTAKIAP